MQRAIKFILSFFKRDWDLSDYPIEVREQYPGTAPAAVPVSMRGKLILWIVRIPNWLRMSGYGDTREEACADLEAKFHEYKSEGHKLPRPGTKVPLQFAPRPQIERHEVTAEDFFIRIFGMNYHNVLITDSSSLWDFPISDPDAITAKIEVVYGVDITDIEDGNLARIFERIEASAA